MIAIPFRNEYSDLFNNTSFMSCEFSANIVFFLKTTKKIAFLFLVI